MSDVSVIGLGAMGSALAEAFLKSGLSVTVWNRTQAKAEALVAKGAVAAASVREAVEASKLVVAAAPRSTRLTSLCWRPITTRRRLPG
jgi:3-hydroxyisobutyrate dehydrogenase-like beta-hydroxyacid dehydrogenase